MLTPEQAKERLKEFQSPENEATLAARVAPLSEPQRTVFYGLLGRDTAGKTAGYQKQYKIVRKAQRQLQRFDEADRVAVFQVLFPTIASHVEAAWQLHSRLPYQSGWGRKPFRWPEVSSSSNDAHVTWLQSLIETVRPYEMPIDWFAAWAPYISGYQGDALGILLAAAIDRGDAEGERVFDILLASARGEHSIGVMGRHVTRALLVAARPEGWDFVEKLLLAAQRQEGLRQAILEAVDEAHPEAFRRILRVIRENELTRFSATIRAIDVWLGFGWDAMSARFAAMALEQVEDFLGDAGKRDAALIGDDPQAVYLALWAMAFQDAPQAVAQAQPLLADPSAERRFAAAYLLTQAGLSTAKQALIPALDDPDLRVAFLALRAHITHGGEGLSDETVFERLERLLARMPTKDKAQEPIIWDWMVIAADRSAVADALTCHLGGRSSKCLIPHLAAMSVHGRAGVADSLAKDEADDPEVRDALLRLVGDSSEYVRSQALKAVTKVPLTPAEAQRMEGLLTRKAGDLRRGVLSLLLAQPDVQTRCSAQRLLAAKDPLPRLAGLEVLQQMVKADRSVTQCRTVAAEYRASAAKTSEAEEAVLDLLLDEAREEPTLENGLGLFQPGECSPRIAPAAPKKKFLFFTQKPEPLISPAARACLQSLDYLVHRHRETPVKVEGRDEMLLGNLAWGLPPPAAHMPLEEDLPRLPLWEIWTDWEKSRPAGTRDEDGLELLRASAAFASQGHYFHYYPTQDAGEKQPWLAEARRILFADEEVKKLQHAAIVQSVLGWLLRLIPPADAADFLLDAVETTLTLLPHSMPGVQHTLPLEWLGEARQYRNAHPDQWTPAHHIRLWQFVHWLDTVKPDRSRNRPPLDELLAALEAGGANEADLLDQIIGPRPTPQYGRQTFAELSQLTGRRGSPFLEAYPRLREAVERCRERILDIELKRGELPTAASAPALSLRSLESIDILVRLLRALGNEGFSRGQHYGWRSADSLTKADVFSHLTRILFPAAGDTPPEFARRVQEAGIGEKRLVELAVYAPQWAGFVQHALDWPELSEAVWWLHAHTKDMQWTVDSEIREIWAAQSAERTPLSSQSLLDGAVDVAWFHRIYAALGPERWKMVDEAAKYASGGGGHKRAQLFADAMLGKLNKADLTARIQQKRNGDAVRALGLVPLAAGDGRDTDVLERYQVMQEFARGSRQFGAQRQASEKMAVGIGLENLARTAGYPDPIRLEWAMEAQAVQFLAEGPVSVTTSDVTVTLAIDEWGMPGLTVTRNGKPLKALPPAAKKAPGVAELVARKTEIGRQASRMRQSLEAAMCRGDLFSGSELAKLMVHPVLAPMLRALVLIGDEVIGYPRDRGQKLEDAEGVRHMITPDAQLRIAHPHDLLQTRRWHVWQRECFLHERIQPFKQVFRELYVLTEAEKGDGHSSRRYAGHQVNRSQAFALLGKRGWVGNPYEGDCRRTFHDVGLTVSLTFDYGYTTPAELEGLTIDQAFFARRGEWKAIDLAQVPPRIFSEAMRDLDLVVSVAHQGGVDPEASASTIEMRSALLREACALMKIENVRMQGAHALIAGHLGTYSVHLGSAVVHRQPGGHLCIVPVHSQHRGRLFLPFADDDPRTAEVISKALLLARDKDIKDPTILEQIYA